MIRKGAALESDEFAEWKGGFVSDDPIVEIIEHGLGLFPIFVEGIVRLFSSATCRRLRAGDVLLTATGSLRLGKLDESFNAQIGNVRAGGAPAPLGCGLAGYHVGR